MPDTNPFASFFFANDPQGASAQAMRQKIALAMMMKKSAYPKTFGEGLSSIGESISDAMMAKSTLRSAAEQAAQADRQIKAIEGGTTPGKISDAAVPGTDQVASAEPVEATPPGGNAPSWNTFAQEYSPGGLGLNQPQAAGLVGNLQAESTPAIKPSGVVGDAGTAFGSAQWRGPRLEALKQYAASQGVSPWTTEAQQGFMRHEMMGTGNQPGREAGAYAALTQTKTPAEAAAVVDERYERSSGEHRGRRIANAENIMQSLPNPRDGAAAVLASRAPPPAGPAGPQDALLGEVTGMAGPASAASFAPTASAGRTGDVMSDMPSVTGAVGGPAGAGVVDTLQQRNDAMRPPQAAVPPPGPQTAQAGPFPAPTLDASGRPAAIIPGGGLPQQIPAAPPDARAAIEKIPTDEYEPKGKPEPQPPIKPGPGPVEQRLGPLLYADVDPRVQAAAKLKIEQERAQSAATYDNALKQHELKKTHWLKEEELLTKYKMDRPQTQLQNAKLRRELEGEGAVPLTPEQRKQFNIPETQSAYLTRRGEIKFGPAGTNVNVNTGEKAQGKGDERLQEKLSESFIKSFEEGNTAGDEIKQLAEMRALAGRVGTGAGAVAKQFLGQWGIKTEGLSEIEALNAGISRLIPQQRVPGSGTSSDFDGQMFKDSIVALGKTLQGNNLIFDTMDGLAKNKLARADVSGRVISGEITRQDGIKEMLGLQRQARDLSDRVKAHLEATGQSKTVAPAIPQKVQDDQARQWLQDNPNDPRAPAVRKKLGM